MAFITCAGCGLKVDNNPEACSHCGAKPRKGARAGIIIAGVIGGIIILSNLLSFLLSDPAPAGAPSMPAATQTVKALPDPAREARVKQALAVATLVKTGLRDPDSVTWQHIRVSEDAGVVCLEYRAKNGFGGLNLERTAYAKGRLNNDAATWNKHCAAKPLYDLDYVRHSL